MNKAELIEAIANDSELSKADAGRAFEAERVAVRTIRSALHRLLSGQNHVYGAVITKVDYGSHNYGYGYGYEYGYGTQAEGRVKAPAGKGNEPAFAKLSS